MKPRHMRILDGETVSTPIILGPNYQEMIGNVVFDAVSHITSFLEPGGGVLNSEDKLQTAQQIRELPLRVYRQGNFTIAVLQELTTNKLFTGCSKRHPKLDRPSPSGALLAVYRASATYAFRVLQERVKVKLDLIQQEKLAQTKVKVKTSKVKKKGKEMCNGDCDKKCGKPKPKPKKK